MFARKVKRLLGQDRLRAYRKMVFKSDVVEKTQHPERAYVEYCKSVEAFRVAKMSMAYSVPKVLDFKHSDGTIIFERINKLVPLKEALCRAPDPSYIMGKLGRALRIIHDHCTIDPALRRPIPQVWIDPNLPLRFIHGDFNFHNICISQDTGELVILDWALSDMFGSEGTVGPAHFDVAWLVSTLMFRSELRLKPVPRVVELVGGFIAEYLARDEKRDELWLEHRRYIIGCIPGFSNLRSARVGVLRSCADVYRFHRIRLKIRRLYIPC